MEKEINFFFLDDLPQDIAETALKEFLDTKLKTQTVTLETQNGKTRAKVTYIKKDLPDISFLDSIDDALIPGTEAHIKISYCASSSESVLQTAIQAKDFKENEEIKYNLPYHEHSQTQFIKAAGDEGLKFIDLDTIEKQRSVLRHFITKIGSNILSGSGIMNVSLPINIFDQRSLLEVFAHQCRLTPQFLEKAGQTKDPNEKLKLAVAFAISRIHLSVTQLKPFNPIWGETFQCKIGDTQWYLEQSCHHPPIYHFYQIGKHFKAYGYQQPEASTGANSVYAKTLGKYTVEYEDGTKHWIYPCDLSMNGTLMGDRTYAIVGKFYIVDKENDRIAYIEFNPDSRGRLGKWFTKKNTFPDFFSGCITKLSETVYNDKDNSYTLQPKFSKWINISGDWTMNCQFEGEDYWDYNNTVHTPLWRMSYTWPSDSTLRSDSWYLKKNNEELAAKAKVEMEEIQRRDRKLRAEYAKSNK